MITVDESSSDRAPDTAPDRAVTINPDESPAQDYDAFWRGYKAGEKKGRVLALSVDSGDGSDHSDDDDSSDASDVSVGCSCFSIACCGLRCSTQFAGTRWWEPILIIVGTGILWYLAVDRDNPLRDARERFIAGVMKTALAGWFPTVVLAIIFRWFSCTTVRSDPEDSEPGCCRKGCMRLTWGTLWLLAGLYFFAAFLTGPMERLGMLDSLECQCGEHLRGQPYEPSSCDPEVWRPRELECSYETTRRAKRWWGSIPESDKSRLCECSEYHKPHHKSWCARRRASRKEGRKYEESRKRKEAEQARFCWWFPRFLSNWFCCFMPRSCRYDSEEYSGGWSSRIGQQYTPE